MFKNNFFKNNFSQIIDNVLILDNNDNYTNNFSKQWKKYQRIQIDSFNNFNISKQYLENLLFQRLNYLKDKNIIELGSGAGRFTEHIVKYAKKCVTVDLSSAIFYNVSNKEKNVVLIKADFIKLEPKEKFDIAICRGVLQHTPNPSKYLIKLFDFVKKDGEVFFDIYPMPKIGLLHPKYFFWRPLLKKLFTYERFEIYLTKNIKNLLKYKRIVKKIFFNSKFMSDALIPIWDYKDNLPLTNEQLENWAILDTLDGIYAKYDQPHSYKRIKNILRKNNIEIIKSNTKRNYFQARKK